MDGKKRGFGGIRSSTRVARLNLEHVGIGKYAPRLHEVRLEKSAAKSDPKKKVRSNIKQETVFSLKMLDAIKENAALFSFATFLIGMIVGHRLTIWRDKRKEFNEIAFPIRQSLLTQIEEIKNQKFRGDCPSREQLVGFGIFVGRWSREKYYKDVEAYCSYYKHNQYLSGPGTGSGRIFITVDDLDALSAAARQLLKYCNLR